MSNLEKERFKCDQCEKYFTEDQMTSTGGDEIYCQNCYPEKLAEEKRSISRKLAVFMYRRCFYGWP